MKQHRIDISKQPAVMIIAVFVLIVGLWAVHYLMAQPSGRASGQMMPLGEILFRNVGGGAGFVVSLLLILYNAVMLARIGIRHMLYPGRTFLPMIFYATLACAFYAGPQSLPVYAASAFAIAGLDLLAAVFGRKADYDRCFRGAFLIGISVLFYAPMAAPAIALPVMLGALSRSGREHVVAFFGLIIPFFICSYVYWGMGEGFLTVGARLFEILSTHAVIPAEATGMTAIFSLSVAVLISCLALGSFAVATASMRTRPYRVGMMFITALVAHGAMIAFPGRSPEMMLTIAAPYAVVAPYFFTRNGGWISLVIYLLSLLSVAAVNL